MFRSCPPGRFTACSFRVHSIRPSSFTSLHTAPHRIAQGTSVPFDSVGARRLMHGMKPLRTTALGQPTTDLFSELLA